MRVGIWFRMGLPEPEIHGRGTDQVKPVVVAKTWYESRINQEICLAIKLCLLLSSFPSSPA